ncbi:MAG TPA: hypothetical protein VF607_08845 [Verrucomicrobiae bacterium]
MNVTSVNSSWLEASLSDTPSAARVSTAAKDSTLARASSALLFLTHNFQAITSSIQAGDLAGAQGAFAALQQQIRSVANKTGISNVFDGTGKIGADYRAIQDALQTGDVATAQSALINFKQDIRATAHHPAVAVNAGASPATDTPAGAAGRPDPAAPGGNHSAITTALPTDRDGTPVHLDLSA